MPELPKIKPNEIYTLSKKASSQLAADLPKPVFGKKSFLSFKAQAILLIILLALTGCLVFFFEFIAKPKTINQALQAEKFEYPVNVAEIKYPSNAIKEKFLDNFTRAGKLVDPTQRYLFLRANFTFLKGFYLSTQSYDYRIQLEKYKKYMYSNYLDYMKQDAEIFNYPCLDILCGTPKYAPEIQTLRDGISASKSINQKVKQGILVDLQSAALSADKEEQFNKYLDALSILQALYTKTPIDEIKTYHQNLNKYINDNFSGKKIPDVLDIK